ncbi:MAG: extracellular solute-binding protein [Sulfuriferula sp.]|nr:extracellular solute-binding protein [Sulfuriferula sp.]
MISTKRRTVLKAILASGPLLAMRPALADTRPIVVMTSYPDTVISLFQSAFEHHYPQYHLQILWRMPFDALPYLQQPKQSGVDVYWSASPRNFAKLAQQGALRKLDIDLAGLPPEIGHTRLTDPGGYYTATEMAGYGFAVNPAVLQRLGVPAPADWTDLTDPRLENMIALPDPVRVGFAPVMVDIVLQAYGWDKGWALWSEIVGNSVLLGRGSTFVTDELAEGRRAIGPTIDFFAVSAIVNGAPLRFVYPARSGINPAQVAITASAPNPDGARAFVEFLVSDAGQRILTHPDIRKLPVRPSVYAQLPVDYFNPFAAADKGGFNYNEQIGLPRMALVTAIFGQMLSYDQPALAGLWHRTHQAEKAGKPVAEIRKLLCTPPITEQQAGDDKMLNAVKHSSEGAQPGAPTAIEIGWKHNSDSSRQQADALLRKIGA